MVVVVVLVVMIGVGAHTGDICREIWLVIDSHSTKPRKNETQIRMVLGANVCVNPLESHILLLLLLLSARTARTRCVPKVCSVGMMLSLIHSLVCVF